MRQKKIKFQYTSRSLWDTPNSNALIPFYFILFFISFPTEWEISLWQPQCCNIPVSPHTNYTLTFSAAFCIFLDKKIKVQLGQKRNWSLIIPKNRHTNILFVELKVQYFINDFQLRGDFRIINPSSLWKLIGV